MAFQLEASQVDIFASFDRAGAIKRELLSFAQEQDCELSTVALAHVYFEKLVLRNVVNKLNRKLMAAVSLVLAAKWNEPKVSTTICLILYRTLRYVSTEVSTTICLILYRTLTYIYT